MALQPFCAILQLGNWSTKDSNLPQGKTVSILVKGQRDVLRHFLITSLPLLHSQGSQSTTPNLRPIHAHCLCPWQTLLMDSNASLLLYYGHRQALLINHQWPFLIIHPCLKANILPLSLGPALPFPLAQPFPGPCPKSLPLTSFQRAKARQGHW